MSDPKTCVAMQPTYLPWPGYFNLIHESDVFVFLDDVQFERRSWQCRNRVLVRGEAQWLTVPVTNAPQATPLKEIHIADDSLWRRKHARTLKHIYEGHPFFTELHDVIAIIESCPSPGLASLTMAIIKQLCAQLGLVRRFEMSSSFGIPGARSERLVTLCRHFGCGEYLSPAGSAGYLAEDGAFERSDVSLRFQQFPSRPYRQKGTTDFVPYLSILDVLANLGSAGTREYIAGGGGESEVD